MSKSELPLERIFELRGFFGPRTHGCECMLSWDEMSALLSMAERCTALQRELEQERAGSRAAQRLLDAARHLAGVLEHEGNGVGLAAAEDRLIRENKLYVDHLTGTTDGEAAK